VFDIHHLLKNGKFPGNFTNSAAVVSGRTNIGPQISVDRMINDGNENV